MAKGDGFLYRYPDIFGTTFPTDDEGDEMITTLPSEVARRLHACREHSKATDRSLMELVEDAMNFHMTGDHLIKDSPCEIHLWVKGQDLGAYVPTTWVGVLLTESELRYVDPDCGGNGDERPFLAPPQNTCPNHYWSDEDLTLSELIAEELPTLIAATLYNRYRFRRG